MAVQTTLLHGWKDLDNDVLVPLVGCCMSQFLEDVTAFVPSGHEVFRILAGLRFCVDDFIVRHRSGLHWGALVPLGQSLPHQLSMFRSPSSGRFLSNILTALMADPDMARSRTLHRSSFACNHMCLATTLGGAVSILPRVDGDGRALL